MPAKLTEQEAASLLANDGESGLAKEISKGRNDRQKTHPALHQKNAVTASAGYVPPLSNAAMDPQLLSTQKPELAFLHGDPNRPIVVPRPEAPIALADVDSFLHHFAVLKGLSKEKEGVDLEMSEDAVLVAMTKWNSPYTVKQDPRPEAATEAGSKVGRNIAIRCVVTKKAHLLQPINEYFNGVEAKAENNLREMTNKDMNDHAQYGHNSWYYVTLMERRFAQAVQVEVIKVARKCATKIQEDKRSGNINTIMDVAAAKAIENRGGIVFGGGGGARGGFEFMARNERQATVNFGASEAPDGQNDGGAGSSRDMAAGQMVPIGQMGVGAGGSPAFMGHSLMASAGVHSGGDMGAVRNTMGNEELHNIFAGGAMKTAMGDLGIGNGGTQRFFSGKEAQAEVEHTSKRARGANGQIVEVGQRASYYDFMGEVQMEDDYNPDRAEGPPEGIGGEFFDKLV